MLANRLAHFALKARQESALRVALDLLRQRGARGWVVGGAVRDALLGRPVLDYDLAVTGDGLELARDLGRRANMAFVPLDTDRRIARLVPRQGAGLQFDIASLVGSDIDADLRQRDLTVNAMAIDLETLLDAPLPHLVDPTGGQDDFTRQVVRVPSAACLDADPLRVMRIYRFACLLHFSIDDRTEAWAHERLPHLARVSPERVRDELFKILSHPASAPCLARMYRNGVLTAALPPVDDNGPHRVEALEALLAHLPLPLCGWFDTVLSETRTRQACLKLAALLESPGDKAAQALRLSAREARSLTRLGATRSQARTVARQPALQGALSYLEAAQEDSVGGVLLSASHQRIHGQAVGAIWAWYQQWRDAGNVPLLRGDDIMRELNIVPGPVVGQLATELRRQQTLGTVRTVEQALAWLRTR